MSTRIVRQPNKATFVCGRFDYDDDEVLIVDQLDKPQTDRLYFIDGYKYIKSKDINEGYYKSVTIEGERYDISDEEMEILLSTGKCSAYGDYGKKIAEVYVGLNVVPRLKELENESIARCYDVIAERKKEYEAEQKEKELLLGVGRRVVQEVNVGKDSYILGQVGTLIMFIETGAFLQGCRMSDSEFVEKQQRDINKAKLELLKIFCKNKL